MDFEQERHMLCEVGAHLYERRLVVAGDGNLSVRAGENDILITPSGVCKGRLEPEMIVHCTIDGAVRASDRSGRQPSSEIALHIRVYARRPDARAVVHAHPPIASAFAVCHKAIDEPYLPETVVNMGEVPVCDFALPSTAAVADSLDPYVDDHQAVLLANHGALSWADSLWAAFDLMEHVEHIATVHAYVSILGGGVALGSDQIARLQELRSFYALRASLDE
ncbi:MAG: class II aldolase/adducin family protein [Eggerthellaceae bacterium]|nr:class II aldolase/adducin family protein [Eggerthellaceae bacterium]